MKVPIWDNRGFGAKENESFKRAGKLIKKLFNSVKAGRSGLVNTIYRKLFV